MANANETKSNTTGSLYLVTYKYINKQGFIRAGQITANAKDPTEAAEIALTKLTTLGVNNPRISNAKLY